MSTLYFIMTAYHADSSELFSQILKVNKTSDFELHNLILTFLQYVMFKKSQQL